MAAAGRVLVGLDDDPTGMQSVSDVPVLTRWEEEDFRWASDIWWEQRPAPAVYVLTNTRSLEPVEAHASWLTPSATMRSRAGRPVNCVVSNENWPHLISSILRQPQFFGGGGSL